ncbi:MAG: putative metal-dependent hydrolase YcfH, partial [Pseudomonadota bacterium]
EPLVNNIDQVLLNAKKNNITNLLTIGTSLDSSKKVLEIVSKYPNVYGAIGIHPNSTTGNLESINEIFLLKKKSKKIIAFGETGLDYFYNRSDKKDQIFAFEKHVEFSILEKVPVIVHTRDADDDTISIIKQYYNKTNFLIHCFTGSLDFAKNLLNLNCLISFSGIITFKKSNDLRDVVKYVPLERMLIETDSPYLSPDPFRGKSNEPANVKIVAENVALIKGISLNKVAELTTKNFKNFFFNEQN